jgi:aryl sulfotransferase
VTEERPIRYHNTVMDSARWAKVAFREGDIVISTPAKCGTTWAQMICALLIFQTPELPRPLSELSAWPDFLVRRIEDLISALEGQRHRRFMKTHTPLDGLPYDERVTYLCVGRDPRDVAISWDHHVSNQDWSTVLAKRAAVVGAGEPAGSAPVAPVPAGSARDRFWAWVDNPDKNSIGLARMLHHLTGFWQASDRPNVVLLHYDDLRQDLDGQMRELAARLRIDIVEPVWPELVRQATFDQMRGQARLVAPSPDHWRDPDRFFHSGTSGQWRELLNADDLRRYFARVRELADPELAGWLHREPVDPPRPGPAATASVPGGR